MDKWSQLASKESIETTIAVLKSHNIEAILVENGEAAKKKVLEMLPEGAEVMTMSSTTLQQIGLVEEIENSPKYDVVKKKLSAMDRATQSREMQRIGAAPEWAIGSVHAVTEDGHAMIASNTGSQLPAYAYGAGHVIWVVGTQKIVKNIDEGMKRIFEHSLPLESERTHKAYGVPGSAVNKVLLVNNEVQSQRITMILVNEVLGF
ncbi:MAG: hypothetical protein A2V81_03005 [Candidatus Abawacabacteria bacterium RBG_16_42_10]|uniref:LUD domain-containing protein n=1 Tax=Candidatus Abawacabacteria bacterium RBG_16_42_10 TaxID=1817814 RepID=A0A1F4XLW6_9BACT|nr:MAG: hypothetical protein A2V81_03005 [Candidatus Abawacabacteria bacterium RBG_16_42_10]